MISTIARTVDVEILCVLLLMLGASAAIFWMLVRRWTTLRPQAALVEWGRNAAFSLVSPSSRKLPSPLAILDSQSVQIETQLESKETTLMRLRAAPPAPRRQSQEPGDIRWNLLVRRLQISWEPVGLRPAHQRHSVLDFFSLSSFSKKGEVERFILFASGTDAARRFPESTARALLPPDVGLLLHQDTMVLDFSGRPFDDLEFNRIIALAAQLELKLAKE